MKMKTKYVYISGPITDNSNAEIDFYGAEESLMNYYRDKAVVKIINPLSICNKDWSWKRCMCWCLLHLIVAEVIWMIPGWETSRGARLEFSVAVLLKKQINYL